MNREIKLLLTLEIMGGGDKDWGGDTLENALIDSIMNRISSVIINPTDPDDVVFIHRANIKVV